MSDRAMLAQCERTILRLECERNEARAELASLKASIDVEIAAMGDRVLRLESERDELATLCAAALCAKGQSDRDRAESIAELRYVRAELNDFDRSLRATVASMDKARVERDEARAQLLAIEKALINVGGELLARRVERDEARDRIAKLEGEVESATARENAAHDTLAMFRRSEGQFDLVPVSRYSLYTLHSMCSSAERKRDEARAEVESLRGELARLRAWATGERGEPSL